MPFFRFVVFLFFIFHFSFASIAIEAPTLVWPKNNMSVYQNDLLFQWNVVSGAEKYELQISSDSQFQNIILETEANFNEFDVNLVDQVFGNYFWRVRALDELLIPYQWSNVYSFEFFSPLNLENLVLWVSADSAVAEIDGKISEWRDLSQNGFHALQPNPDFQPIFVENILAGKPIIRFDGLNDFLLTNFQSTLPQPNSVFIVYNLQGTGNRVVFDGYSTTGRNMLDFTGSAIRAWSGTGIQYAKSAPFGFILNSIIFNFSSSQLFENGLLRISGNSGSNSLTGLTIGNHVSLGRYFQGDIAEIILLDQAISNSQREKTENYFRNKYFPSQFFPPVNLGFDIKVEYGFAPQAISAASFYQNYYWSTGQNSAEISVNNSGLYFLNVTDIYGIVSSDTIKVSYPSTKLNESSQLICAGDTLKIFSEILFPEGYTYEWNTGHTSSELAVTEQGQYWVKIIDNEGLFSFSDTIAITVDNFPQEFSLGPDLDLCVGNIIEALPSQNTDGFSFLWSTGSEESFIEVYETGSYSATVTNPLGCVAFDDLFITITGSAPQVFFTSEETICLGNPIEFFDSSIAGDEFEIESWDWDFGDGFGSIEQNPIHVFLDSGTKEITLTVYSANGCFNSLAKQIVVLPLPLASFDIDIACIDNPFQIIDLSEATDGFEILEWLWLIGSDYSTNEQNPIYTFSEPGFFQIELQVTDVNGCQDSVSQALEVLSSFSEPEIFSIIQPQNGSVYIPGLVDFQTNFSENATFYTLQVSLDPGFDILLFELPVNALSIESINFNEPGKYYVRILAENICGDLTFSESVGFIIFDPAAIESLVLWLNGSEVIQTDQKVTQWLDLSGQNHHVSQEIAVNKPSFVDNGLHGQPVIRFDGNQYLSGGNILNLETYNRTSFILGKSNSNNSAYLGKTINVSSPNRWGYTYINGVFYKLFQETSAKHITINRDHGNFEIVSSLLDRSIPEHKLFFNNVLTNAGSIDPAYNMVSETRFLVGAYSNEAGNGIFRPLNGDIAEILIYNKALSEEERNLIYGYLQHKYSPPVNLGPDKRTAYGFCPVELDAGDRFVSYLWSTGQTTSSIMVNEPGSYSVTVTDIFGFVSSDEVEVRYPEAALNVEEEVICLGESLEISAQGAGLRAQGMEHRAQSAERRAQGEEHGAQGAERRAQGEEHRAQGKAVVGSGSRQASGYSFLWNTGETTPSITVSEEGLYTLTISDTLGCSRVLSAYVTVDRFSETASLGEDRPFCLGAELALEIQGSRFKVQGERSDSPFGGGWGEVVSDASSMFNVQSSRLKTSSVLPETLNVNRAKGELLSEAKKPETGITYSWSTGANTPTIIINEIGTYWVNVINENGCLATDTVTLSFQGYNPDVAFQADSVCPGEAMSFVNLSTVEQGSIVGWLWDFGDGTTSEESEPVHVPGFGPGFSEVSLAAVTDAGCANAVSLPVRVYFEPQVHFTPNNACTGAPVEFLDQSSDPDGFGLAAWAWDFGPMGISSEQNPVVTFTEAGNLNVALTVTSAKACSSTLTRELTIRQSPDIDFDWTTACVGEPVAFADLSSAPPWVTISSRHWDFGDGTTSTQLNPTHLYPDDGIYAVTLTLGAMNGCVVSLTNNVIVHSLPEVNFAGDDLCAGAPHTFMDLSSVENSELAAWQWTFGALGASTEQHPVFAFTEEGQYAVGLEATSAAGCSNALIRTIRVNPAPLAGFSFFPRFGVAPLNVGFTNTSLDAVSYLWDFGDGSPLSAQANPTHTYTSNGIYYPELIAYTSFGCPDTTRHELKVIPLSVDIAVTQVTYTLQGGFMEVRANLLNLGTLELDTLWLDLHLAGTTPLREQWTGLLRGGVITSYTFSARLPVRDINNHDFLCVTASVPGIDQDDNPDNDTFCVTFSNEFRVLDPRPNPAFDEVTVPFILPYEGPVQITLYDLFGNVLSDQQTAMAPAGLNFVTLPMHYLRSGTYVVRVIFRESTGVKRVVKL